MISNVEMYTWTNCHQSMGRPKLFLNMRKKIIGAKAKVCKV